MRAFGERTSRTEIRKRISVKSAPYSGILSSGRLWRIEFSSSAFNGALNAAACRENRWREIDFIKSHFARDIIACDLTAFRQEDLMHRPAYQHR